MAMAHIAPFSREAEDESAAFAAQSARLEREFGAQVTVVPNPQVVELSSTEVRAALAQGGGEPLQRTPTQKGAVDVDVEDQLFRSHFSFSPRKVFP